jgi:hypothetical protein
MRSSALHSYLDLFTLRPSTHRVPYLYCSSFTCLSAALVHTASIHSLLVCGYCSSFTCRSVAFVHTASILTIGMRVLLFIYMSICGSLSRCATTFSCAVWICGVVLVIHMSICRSCLHCVRPLHCVPYWYAEHCSSYMLICGSRSHCVQPCSTVHMWSTAVHSLDLFFCDETSPSLIGNYSLPFAFFTIPY